VGSGDNYGLIVLQIVSLTKSFSDPGALESVGFSVHEGEVLGLIGPNGAGRRRCSKRLPVFFKSIQVRFVSAINSCHYGGGVK